MTVEILIQVEGDRINPDQLAEELEDFLMDDSLLSKVYVEVTDVQDDGLSEETEE